LPDAGLGYEGGRFVRRRIGGAISGLFWTDISRQGGPAFSRPIASLVVAVLMIASILVLRREPASPQRA
jgi:hypothetical protein